MQKIYILILSVMFYGIACSHNSREKMPEFYGDYLIVPSHFPEPPFPINNPYSKEKAELGRFLFYEPLLVRDTSFPSCSHCMKQEHAFTNNVSYSRGIDHISENRNNMTLVNVVYRKELFWDGRGNSIDKIAYRSMWMPTIFGSDTNEIVKRLENSDIYPIMFKKAFGANTKISPQLISQAIATFVRTMISGNSRYDSYISGDKSALSKEEQEGMKLFFSERTRCSVCHSGIFFTDGLPHNTGVTTNYFDKGRYEVTGLRQHRGTFLTPTLRNIEKTGPYMHDGELYGLDAVMEHYNRGGRAFALKDTLMRPLNLNKSEIKAMIAFLKSLTDSNFINSRKYSDPHLLNAMLK